MKIKREDLHIRDPFILADGGKFYMYGTCNMANALEAKDKEPNQGFSSFVSLDLETFDGPYHAFDRFEGFWGEKSYWAPEVYKLKDGYYMFATFFSEKDGRRCQILKSDNPLTGFTPWSEPFTPEGWWCLDATLFFHEGKPYSVFCHEWLQVKNGEMWITELSSDLKKAVGEPKLIFKAADAPWSKSWGDGNCITDGPFVHKNKNGKLVMMWSSGGAKGYTMGMAVNDGKDVFSGWTQLSKPLYAEDGGHGMIFEKDGKLFISIHAPNSVAERPHFIEIRETEDGLETV